MTKIHNIRKKYFRGTAILLASAMILQTCTPAFADTGSEGIFSEEVVSEEVVSEETTDTESMSDKVSEPDSAESEKEYPVNPSAEYASGSAEIPVEDFKELSGFTELLGAGEYAVTAECRPDDKGTVRFDKAGGKAGDKIRFMIFPENNYRIDSVSFEPEITATKSEAGIYSFLMPAENVHITVEFGDSRNVGELRIDSDEEISEGVDYSYSDSTKVLTILSDARIEISNIDPSKAARQKIRIPSGVAANLILAGVNLTWGTRNDSVISIADNNPEDVHIYLKEGTENIISAAEAIAIGKRGNENSGWLIIGGEGSLEAVTSLWVLPAIGEQSAVGNPGHADNIRIESGNIYIARHSDQGKNNASAIGGGYNTCGKNIFITGGCVTFGVGFEYPMGGGVSPYGKRNETANIVVTENASVKFYADKAPCTVDAPDSDTRVYEYEIDNPNGLDIMIDGVAFPYTKHETPHLSEKKVYVHLTAGSETDLHEIRVGDDRSFVYYDTVSKEWKEPEKKVQEKLSFELDNPRIFSPDMSRPIEYTNTLTNPNAGAATFFTSSNPEVAQIVDAAKGTLHIWKAGTAVIKVVSKKAGYADTYASYELEVRKLSAINTEQSAHGQLSVDVAEAASGEIIHVHTVPDAGYEAGEITVTGESGEKYKVKMDGNDGSFVMPDEKVTVSAVFASLQFTISVHQVDYGWLVAPEKGRPGVEIHLKTICDPGWGLDSFEIKADKATESVSKTGFSFVMPEDNVTITPHYKRQTYAIKTVDSENGSVTTDRVKAQHNEIINFEAMPEFDFRIATISVLTDDGKPVDVFATPSGEGDKRYVGHFTMPGDNVTVEAVFVRIPHAVCIVSSADGESGKGGKVTVDSETAICGQTVTVTVTPDSNYSLSYISVSDEEVEIKTVEDGKYTFTMPSNDVTVTAAFIKAGKGSKANPWYVGTDGSSGSKTNDVTAYIGGDNTLYLEAKADGTGNMWDYGDKETPWYNLYNSLKHMVVSDGVKHLGNCTLHHFFRLHNFYTVLLPDSLESIGSNAISTLHYLSEIEIPAGVKTIGSQAFYKDESLKKIVFKGRPENIAGNAFQGVTADVYIPMSWLDGGQFNPEEHQYGGILNYIIVGEGDTYTVSCKRTAKGRFIPEKNYAKAGERVYITPAADPGYYMTDIEITPHVEYKKESGPDGRIYFTMPDCNVTVTGTFGQPGTEAEPWLVGRDTQTDVQAYFDERDGSMNVIVAALSDAEMMDFEEGKQPWYGIKDQIQSVKLYDAKLINIGAHAFENCSNLESIVLTGVDVIGDCAFKDCPNLKNESMVNSGLGKLKKIGASAFENDRSLTRVSLNCIESLGTGAFKGCTGITAVTVGDVSKSEEILHPLTALDAEAFAGCSALTSVELAAPVKSLGVKSFSGCGALNDLKLSDGLEYIGDDCFENCYALRDIDFMKYQRMAIAPNAFKNVTAYVKIGKNYLRNTADDKVQINDPGGAYYYGAKRLQYVVDNKSDPANYHVVRIKQSYSGTVMVDGNVDYPGGFVMLDFTSFGSYQRGSIISVSPKNLKLERQSWVDEVPGYERRDIYTFHMPDQDVEITIRFSNGEDIISDELPDPGPEDVWYIGAENPMAVKAWITDNVLHIEGTGNIKEHYITLVPWFQKRGSIRDVVISEGITGLSSFLFFGMEQVKTVKLPSTLKTIGEDAFSGSSLTDIQIPKSVTKVDYDAFYNCDALKSITFEGKPSYFHEKAYEGITANVYVPRSWLSGGVTEAQLNDPNGKYQYAGKMTYIVSGSVNHTVTLKSGGGGKITADKASAPANAKVYLTVTPDEGYEFSKITLSSGQVDTDVLSFVMPDQDVTATAEFVKTQYQISSSHSDGCNLNPDAFSAVMGTTIRIHPKTDTGYMITGCEVTGKKSGRKIQVTDYSFVMPAEDVSITLTAEKEPFYIKVFGSDYGVASVPRPTAVYGEKVNVKVNANPHFGFKSIRVVADGKRISSSGSSFTMPAADVEVTPEFERSYAFNLSSTTGGTVSSKGYTGFAGTKITLSTSILPGYIFDKWEITGGITIDEKNSFLMPENDVSVKAVFAKDTSLYRIVCWEAEGGSIRTASASETGKKIALTVMTNPGYELRGVTVQGSKTGTYYTVAGNSFTMPEEDVNIIPVFVKKTYGIHLIIDQESRKYGTAVISTPSEPYAQIGDEVTISFVCGKDCNVKMEVSPFAEIRDNGDGTASFDMPFAETDVIVLFTPKQGSETYPWYVGKDIDTDLKVWINDEGTLMIEGTGDMTDWDNEAAPWFSVNRKIQRINIASPSVGYPGNHAFEGIRCSTMVPHSWPDPDITLKQLNDPDGDYQYGGEITYFRRTGLHRIKTDPELINGSILISDNSADPGEKIRVTCIPDAGYRQTGFTVRDSAGKEIPRTEPFTFIMPDSDVTLSAAFAPMRYTVTYDANGHGTAPEATVCEYKALLIEPEAPSEPGYTFTGWATDSSADAVGRWDFAADTMPHQNLTLYACWNPDLHTVKWVNDDGTELETDENVPQGTMPEYNGDVPQKASDSQQGSITYYYFNGWNPEVKVLEGSLPETMIYKATYSSQSFMKPAIKYMANGHGENIPLIEHHAAGEKISEPEQPTATGYVFGGWYKKASCREADRFVFDTMPALSIVLYAKWTVQTFDICWQNYDGAELLATKSEYGRVPAYRGDLPEREETSVCTYQFAGWNPEPVPAVENATYSAVYEAATKSYTVAFDTRGHGNAPAYQYVRVGEKLQKPEDPATAGFSFDKWFADKECTVPWDFEADTMPDHDMILYAKWIIKSYSVTWKNYDGKILADFIGVTYGSMPRYNGPAPQRPMTADYVYTFDHWTPEPDIVLKSQIYTAVFKEERRTYTVSFDAGGHGTAPGNQEVSRGDSIQEPAEPADEGYTFTGWFTDKACSPESRWDFENDKMPASRLTLYAGWEINDYLITWKNYDGTVLATKSLAYGSMPVYTGPAPYRESSAGYRYQFSGWEPQISPVRCDTVYTAHYTSGQVNAGGNASKAHPARPKTAVKGMWTYHPESNTWTFNAAGQAYRECWGYIENPYAQKDQQPADWFYFNSEGIMLTGWQWIKDSDGVTRCYYLNPVSDHTLGACFLGPGTTPDGYTVDVNGAWVVNGIVQTRP